jgi:sulfide dehydrogenase [flavocytochrome c] flavoprotein chain
LQHKKNKENAMTSPINRRSFVKNSSALLGAAGTLGLMAGCASSASGPKVVVVGGGYGGATAAKYIRMWSDYGIQVTLVEPNAAFVSCPISNLVLGGSKTMADVTTPYDNLKSRHGVNLVRDMVTAIDADKRIVKLAGGSELPYDRLIVSPGVDFMWESLPGMNRPGAQDKVLHAWKAGPQTMALRRQLEALPNGGVYALSIPLAPYRCPPGPYERACQIASYFKAAKPRSKVLILDANDDVTSKGPLFKKAWADRYAGIIEYRPKHTVVDVDAATNTLKFEFNNDLKVDVLNVLPAMRAGEIAVKSGLATANRRWCEVDFLTFESRAAKNVHVIGDSIQTAALMPKSGHMANQHAKTCAAAVVALLSGQTPNPAPIYNNTCYSFVSPDEVVHVSSVHAYNATGKTMTVVAGAGGVSSAASALEGAYAFAWAQNIWADSLA